MFLLCVDTHIYIYIYIYSKKGMTAALVLVLLLLRSSPAMPIFTKIICICMQADKSRRSDPEHTPVLYIFHFLYIQC
jgi:hypothetical protein